MLPETDVSWLDLQLRYSTDLSTRNTLAARHLQYFSLKRCPSSRESARNSGTRHADVVLPGP